jgi:CheY-like chemotaxis protein
MLDSKLVVVVVPDIALQRSLVFALEADGYRVTTSEIWQAASAFLLEASCFIVDQKIVMEDASLEAYIRIPSNRAIVLSDDPLPYERDGIRVLTKPLIGVEVLTAVNEFKDANAVSPVRI